MSESLSTAAEIELRTDAKQRRETFRAVFDSDASVYAQSVHDMAEDIDTLRASLAERTHERDFARDLAAQREKRADLNLERAEKVEAALRTAPPAEDPRGRRMPSEEEVKRAICSEAHLMPWPKFPDRETRQARAVLALLERQPAETPEPKGGDEPDDYRESPSTTSDIAPGPKCEPAGGAYRDADDFSDAVVVSGPAWPAEPASTRASDLVERLRALIASSGLHGFDNLQQPREALHEAATRIADLEAQNRALKEGLRDIVDGVGCQPGYITTRGLQRASVLLRANEGEK